MVSVNYRGYEITKTGKTYQDYMVNLQGRTRWGTLFEIKKDVDDFINGIMPAKIRGYI